MSSFPLLATFQCGQMGFRACVSAVFMHQLLSPSLLSGAQADGTCKKRDRQQLIDELGNFLVRTHANIFYVFLFLKG